jgi:hypothetical protein
MKQGPRIRLSAACTAALASVALAVPGFASAANPTQIGGTIQHPIGIAALKDKLLITQECVDQVMVMDRGGNVSPYATLPDNPTCPEVEDYIAAVPQDARAPWQPNDAYVIAGDRIYRLDQRGRVSLLSTGPCSDDTQAAIAFDRWGTWGGGLIAQCGGRIYKVDAAGGATFVVDIGAYSEGAQVIPPGSVLPQYTGWLIVAEEFANGGQVEVISPNGSQHVVVGAWSDAEHVEFITQSPCTFGTTGGAFFAAAPTSTLGYVLAYPRSDFNGLAGRFVVSGEDGVGLGLLNGPGNVTPFDTGRGGTLEGASFVDWSRSCAV